MFAYPQTFRGRRIGAFPCPPQLQPSPREEHARLLTIAAARRLRALERSRALRPEDAEYWRQVAPAAVRKAATLRCGGAFSRLP